MVLEKDQCWLEIDLARLEKNYRLVEKGLKNGCQIIGVVKSNCYGLGAVKISRKLEALGCPILSVSNLGEAEELRQAGIPLPILLLGPIQPAYAEMAIRQNYRVPLVSVAQAKELSKAACACGGKLKADIKVDVGLSRFGFVLKDRPEEAAEEIAGVLTMPGLEIESMMTHFTVASGVGADEFNRTQYQLFADVHQLLARKGHYLKRHCSSSLFHSIYPEYDGEFIRLASLLYGLQREIPTAPPVKCIVQLKANILQIKKVPADTPVSYGPLFYTKRETNLGIVNIGFGDGLLRSCANRAEMLVRGRRVPLLGKPGMNFSMLDLTDLPEAKEGDLVTVFGEEDGAYVSLQEYAAFYQGVGCEVPTYLSAKMPRIYMEE